MVNLGLIKDLCAAKGVSVRKMAIDSGLTQSTVASMIKNNSTTLENLEKISNYFGISPAAFFNAHTEPAVVCLRNAFERDLKRIEDFWKLDEQITKMLAFLIGLDYSEFENKDFEKTLAELPSAKQKEFHKQFKERTSRNGYISMILEIIKETPSMQFLTKLTADDIKNLWKANFMSKGIAVFILRFVFEVPFDNDDLPFSNSLRNYVFKHREYTNPYNTVTKIRL